MCYEYIAGNDPWYSPYADHNNSQTCIELSLIPERVTSKDAGNVAIEMENNNIVPGSSDHAPHRDVSVKVQTIPLRDDCGPSLKTKHDYEELVVEFLKEHKRKSFIGSLSGHDYDEPTGLLEAFMPFMPLGFAGEYEEPVSQRRLSLPSIMDMSLLHKSQLQRRNSSVCELSSIGSRELIDAGKEHLKKRPFRIKHYAEISLCLPKSDFQSSIDSADHVITDKTLTGEEIHQYDEPFSEATNIHHPLCAQHVPAPLKLLNKVVHDYEIPVMSPLLPKASATHSRKLKRNRFPVRISSNPDDEVIERLLDEVERYTEEEKFTELDTNAAEESNSAETHVEPIKSPCDINGDILSSSCSQDSGVMVNPEEVSL